MVKEVTTGLKCCPLSKCLNPCFVCLELDSGSRSEALWVLVFANGGKKSTHCSYSHWTMFSSLKAPLDHTELLSNQTAICQCFQNSLKEALGYHFPPKSSQHIRVEKNHSQKKVLAEYLLDDPFLYNFSSTNGIKKGGEKANDLFRGPRGILHCCLRVSCTSALKY